MVLLAFPKSRVAALALAAFAAAAPLTYARVCYAQTSDAQNAPLTPSTAPATGSSTVTPGPMGPGRTMSSQTTQDHLQDHAGSGAMKGRRRGMAPAETIEQRVAALHQRLHVTADQEPLWKNVAQVMRDDAQAVEAAAKARQEKLATMTALDNLRSFQNLAQTHADGLNKLLDAFAPLYAAMSDDQKKNADAVLRYQSANAGPRRGQHRP